MMSAIHPKGILFGLAAFAVLYIGGTFLANVIVRVVENPQSAVLWLNPLAFLAWLVSGYIAAVFAKKKGMLNGALFGLLSISVVSFAQYIFGGVEGFKYTFHSYYYWIGIGVLIGGLGGWLWDIYAKLRNKSL